MARTSRWQRYWDRKAPTYDKEMATWEQRLFRDSRQWACQQATGHVLEVAVGTGLNLPLYPTSTTLTGIDISDQMLDRARTRPRPADLRQGDAQALTFDDATFDTVVCTFGLCAIPDMDTAIKEMIRVLRPNGQLILVDHVPSSSPVIRAVQWLLERVTVPLAGEHFLRRPANHLHGLAIERQERFSRGLIERVVARKPV